MHMPEQERHSEGPILRFSVLLLTLLAVAMCLLLYWQTNHLRKEQKWVEHSYQVQVEIESLDRRLREAESTQRALLLTGKGDRGLIEELGFFSTEARAALKRLEGLVTDNALQSAQIRFLSPLLDARLETLARSVASQGAVTPEELEARIRKGVELTRKIDQRLDSIRKAEEMLLDGRASGASTSAERLVGLAIGGTGLGLIVLVLSVIHETKERKLRRQYQGRLAEARDNALDAVKATSNFVASVSHEIRTPMNGVLGAADLLHHDRRLDRGQRELVETIRYSGEALLELINDILDLSKLQAGKMTFARVEFSLTEVLDEALALFSDSAGRKELELTYRLNSSVPRRIIGDPGRLRQVLVNLVGNAVKFTDSGSVLVRVEEGREQDSRPNLLFYVTDTGVGIGKEEQQHLFQPFSQINPALKNRHSGTGLGLAVSREIVQQMQGAMGVDSAPGKGSTFWFTMRLFPADFVSEEGAKLKDGGTLLLIEAREQTAHSIEQHVLGWGMQVVIVSDLAELRALPVIPDLAAVVIGQPLGSSWQDVAGFLMRRPEAARALRFLLAHPQDPPSAEMLSDLGIRARLRFPFRPSDLYDLLADEPVAEIAVAPDLSLHAARVLLVEDNPVNQRVFTRQLAALGVAVEIRGDGGEGITARFEGGYDVVLMDCQLPTVDGFEATRRIREREAREGLPRIPIVAVTAHVMSGDAEACFQAGMDDYLPKPFDLEKLRRKLSLWITPAADAGVAMTGDMGPPVDILDEPQLRACLTGEAADDEELIAMALEEAAGITVKMGEALLANDDPAWRRAAHRGKGSCATLGMKELAAVFGAAEHDDGSASARETTLSALPVVLKRTQGALRELPEHFGGR